MWEVVSGPLAKIGAPVNYAAPEEIKKEQLKQSSSQGYQDLAEDAVLGIACSGGRASLSAVRQRSAVSAEVYQMDIALVAARAARCAVVAERLCLRLLRPGIARDAAAAGAPAGTSEKDDVCEGLCARHETGGRDDADPDQNDRPLPLAALQSLTRTQTLNPSRRRPRRRRRCRRPPIPAADGLRSTTTTSAEALAAIHWRRSPPQTRGAPRQGQGRARAQRQSSAPG